MKKIYQNPETRVIRLVVAHMIAGSYTMGIGDSVNSASGAESRRGGYSWDDEEE